MDELFTWAPVLWLARVLLVLALLAAAAVMLLLLARLLRPSTLRAIIASDLPSLKGIKASLRLLGQEFEANVQMDSRRDEQLQSLERRLTEAEKLLDAHGLALQDLIREVRHGRGDENER